jgi:hypothetical protein
MSGYTLARCARCTGRTAGDRLALNEHTRVMSEPLDWTAGRSEPLGARPAPVTDMATANPNPVGTPNQRAPLRRTGLVVAITVLVTLGLIAAAGGGWWWLHRTSGPSAHQLAITACETSLRGQLKSPATAQFSGETAVPDGDDRLFVSGDVDAQNSFGALLRSHWTCHAIFNSNDEWQASAQIAG